MKHRLLVFILTLTLLLPVLSCNAAAVTRYRLNGGKRFVVAGGANEYNEIVCENKEETYALEMQLRASDYVLMNTDDREITEDDLKTLTGYSYVPPFNEYLDNKSELLWDMQMCKVYFYKPSLDDALEQLRSEGKVDVTTAFELSTSAVLIDYADWFFKERVGKVLNEFNDNIPSWCTETGFLEIRSPIDARVILEFWDEHTYEMFYVKGGQPLLVKVKDGLHNVREINYIGIAEKEPAIDLQSLYVRGERDTIDNPKVMNLSGIVEKYKITPLDISDKPDYSWGNKDNLEREDYKLPVESVEVASVPEVEEVPVKPKANIFWLLGIVALVAGLLYFVYKKGTKGEKKDD